MEEISLSSNIGKLLELYPGIEEVFKQLEYKCCDCVVVYEDTVEIASKLHKKDVSVLIKKLNEFVERHVTSNRQ